MVEARKGLIFNRFLWLLLLRLIVFFNLQSDVTRFLNSIIRVDQKQVSSAVFAAAFCPQQCHCDDPNLRVICSNANLDVVPITLIPKLKELNLNDNHIRTIREASFSVYQNLESLDLSGNHLNNTEDKAFVGQHKLRVLKMERNTISALTNQTFAGLDSLEVLLLGENRITNITTSVFKQLKKLETLDLTKNEIHYIAPDAFERLNNLRHLYLRGNRLGMANEDQLRNNRSTTSSGGMEDNQFLFLPSLSSNYLGNLVRLDLGSNKFNVIKKVFSPFWFGEMEKEKQEKELLMDETVERQKGFTLHHPKRLWSHLQELYLDGCAIRHIEPESLNSLGSLLILRIHDNHFEDIPKEALSHLSNLQVLQIGQNPFEKITSEGFASLTRLKSLDISRCPSLRTIDPFAFVGVDKLQRLELSHNPKLTFLDPQVFGPLLHLRYLSLRGNGLSTLDPRFSSIGRQLEILDLRDNPFTCNCSIQWIRKLFISYRNHSSSRIQKPEESESENPKVKAAKKSSVTINYEGLLPEPLRQLPPNKSSSDSHSSKSSSTLPSTKSYMLRVIDVKCANPTPLREKLLINLDPDDIGCFEVESMAPIVIAVMIACVILFGVIIICAITCRTRLTVLIKGTSAKNHYPTTGKFSEPVNNNRKVFGLSGTRRVNDLEYHYAKSECIVHDVNVDSGVINNLNNPYEVIPALDCRESDASSMDEGMRKYFKCTPITEL